MNPYLQPTEEPKGYVRLWRKLLTSPVWGMPAVYTKVWLYILMTVPHSGPSRGARVFRYHAEGLGDISHDQWKRALAQLQAIDSIDVQQVRHGCLIRIKNWDIYQGRRAQESGMVATWEAHVRGTLSANSKVELLRIADQHGELVARAHLANYLAATKPRYCSINRFAETFGTWEKPHTEKEEKQSHDGRPRQRGKLHGHTGDSDYSDLGDN